MPGLAPTIQESHQSSEEVPNDIWPELPLNFDGTLELLEPNQALDFYFSGERHFVSRIALRSSGKGVIIWYKIVSSIHKITTK